MMMEMEDLRNRMRDINSMKVTREVQAVCLGSNVFYVADFLRV